MPEVNPQTYHVSASSIAAFKACPTRFRLQYREGIRLVEDTDSQRVGTNWHAMHERYADTLRDCDTRGAACMTTEDAKEAALSAVISLLNERYVSPPSYKTVEEFSLERQQLLTCFVGYLWYYQNDPIEFLASEVPFNLPLHMPRSGMPLPMSEVVRVGKIDHVIKWQGGYGALERKSTSRSIAPDSDYWEKSRKDTQVSMYALAFQDMLESATELSAVVPPPNRGYRIGNTLYDVWHKPTIKPAMLTQAETKAFIETGEYCGQKFEVWTGSAESGPPSAVNVNGEAAAVEQGKKGFAIRETVEMYGARLLADIFARPEFYYARREIARTDAELRSFRQQLFAVYSAQKAYEKAGCWFENESQCRATFPCPYIPICYGPGAAAVCDGKTTPAGYKRIFVDLTVNGQSTEE